MLQEEMSQDQVLHDVRMSPLERLELAFSLSDSALELQKKRQPPSKEVSSVQWIELHKISSSDAEKKPR